ncbi:MAG: hypothetical protein B6D59_01560 [Campylobacteraceae bacterium 4484_4]|nr:MAG: hypothetical protein B6D59_01560 [Campylobacteraceae bacterium 4484_4]
MKKSACPLDCYDACSVIYEDGKLKGEPEHPITRGSLCPNLNAFLKTPRIEMPIFRGDAITMEEALEILTQKLEECDPAKTLFFQGSGNFGKMQDVTRLFFGRYGATFTGGSLCDGAGAAGIEEGRGKNMIMTPEQIAKSDVVVVWGRNLTVTNSHLWPYIKDKILIVIDPVKTEIAKRAHIHIQLKPRSDIYLALLFIRFAYIEQMEDEAYIEAYTEDFSYFIDFARSYGMKKLMALVDASIDDIMTALALIEKQKVAFLVGVGVQKYTIGDAVLRAIDSFAAMLGLFGKEGCGVSYLGESGLGFSDPFALSNVKRIPKPTVNFGAFDLAFIQGANPAAQMPDSNRVIEGLKRCGFSVYFGLYENETSELADLVIPAKTFLEKEDLRLSYGHEFVEDMPKLIESDTGISEYDLADNLCRRFGYEPLLSEREYIDRIIASNTTLKEGRLISKSYEEIPYQDGFDTDDEAFLFIDTLDDSWKEEAGYHLITCKSRHSLNSQFERQRYVWLPESAGVEEGSFVRLSSPYGSAEFCVKICKDLRDDTILIYSGTSGVNRLTPSLLSNEGDSAVYQEVKIQLEKI